MNDFATPALDAWNAKYGTSTPEQLARNLERLRSRARHNEASAIGHARREGERAEREKWQGVVADKDAALANKDAALMEQISENEKLRRQLAELQSNREGLMRGCSGKIKP